MPSEVSEAPKTKENKTSDLIMQNSQILTGLSSGHFEVGQSSSGSSKDTVLVEIDTVSKYRTPASV